MARIAGKSLFSFTSSPLNYVHHPSFPVGEQSVLPSVHPKTSPNCFSFLFSEKHDGHCYGEGNTAGNCRGQDENRFRACMDGIGSSNKFN